MRKILKSVIALSLFLALPPISALAQEQAEADAETPTQAASRALELSAEEQADVARIEAYLNGLTTVRAKFQQYSNSDGLVAGRIYLRRPGRLRVEYDPPSAVLLVADGLALSYFDRELNNLEQAPLNLSPLWFLLRENVHLGGDVTITSFARDAGTIEIGLVQTDEPDAGQVELQFGDKPLELRQWLLTDASGGTVRVGLYDTEFGVELANELFATPRKRQRDEK